ncbi:DNA mismatch repair protein MutS [Prochlorococcus sp. MIT 1307]|uniref:DNA mismatch repair protein MutS n=1 Tax=Prochlorococcus sp. MIT 1307 TaxID=3096219 RepID=UPI002A756C55|nr:DNA mismatch repair protein MutS [Prochlorococcus sp. MIT 1307]
MAADVEPLQGSLFGDAKAVSIDSKYSPSNNLKSSDDFSDEELTKDAQLRPRKAKSTNFKSGKEFLSSSNDNSSSNSDLPTWSHHNLVDIELLTPVLKHYVELKTANPERVLLYRLGDFFECFFEDAIKLSQILDLTLTGKEGGKTIGRVPMAGVPHHAAERYCAELIRKGLSVAICDQLENTPSKGNLIKRGITRVLTPGTVIEEGMLQARRNNWLAAVVIESKSQKQSLCWGLATADVSTGEFLVMEREGSSSLYQELNKLEASEVLCSKNEVETPNDWCPDRLHLTQTQKTPFSRPEAELTLKAHFELTTINGSGLQNWPLALRAAGGLLSYLNNTNPINDASECFGSSAKIPLDLPKITFQEDSLVIDAQTRRNLEITSTQRDGQFHGSLLWAIDKTLTAMGGRCLRRWLDKPLIKASDIRARQEIISELVASRGLRKSIRKLLRSMGDLERLAGRAGAGQAGARDLVAIADGLDRLPHLAEQLKSISAKGPSWLTTLTQENKELMQLAELIHNQLIDNPPLSLSEGGLIHDGVDQLLDGLRNQLDDHNTWLKSQEELEKKLSQNINLRLQYHRTFGYFLAVKKSKAKQVPEHWIRRQTLSNEERFITPEIKAREGKIFQSRARAARREYDIFCNLREIIGNKANSIRDSARSIAGLDALTGLAEIAATNYYCKPTIIDENSKNNSRIINIEGCRHPVVEQILVEESFKPNNVKLGSGTDLIILTGPNASGKSCYLRQIGLVQLIAQIGSWVPAKKASLSITDKIFTRVGAVDDLAAGQSTFMVEMAETAYILNHATNRSLVLLDEIGRGTATFDGLSIAWSVSEFLAKKIQSRTIFATHYHELNNLSDSLNNVENFQVLVEESGKELHFLHQVAPGGANRSYGIEAARLAGVPKDVIQRAHYLLNQLQKKEIIHE